MDLAQARELLLTKQEELRELIAGTTSDQRNDREAAEEAGDMTDSAIPLDAQAVDDAVAESLTDRLARVERALQRIADGSYGKSVLSGAPIPDARLEADPAAELTVEEAAAQQE